MTIAPMTESEVADVSRLLRSSYTLLQELEGLSEEQTEFLKTERGSVESIESELESQRYFVARDGGGVVGAAAICGDMITKLYVDPGHMRRGVGRALYEAAESAIREDGHARVILGAFSTAVPFYERMGLSVIGQKEPRGGLSGVTLLLMEKRLLPPGP